MLTMFPPHTNFDIDVLTISFLWFDEVGKSNTFKNARNYITKQQHAYCKYLSFRALITNTKVLKS